MNMEKLGEVLLLRKIVGVSHAMNEGKVVSVGLKLDDGTMITLGAVDMRVDHMELNKGQPDTLAK